MKTKYIIILFRLQIFISICIGGYAWFTWWITERNEYLYILYSLFAIVSYFYKKRLRIKLISNIYIYIAYISLCLATLFYNRFSFPSLIGLTLLYYAFWVLISDRANAKNNLYVIIRYLSYILIISIIEYIFILIYRIPGFLTVKGEYDSYVFFNYIFNLIPTNNTNIRFQSFFLEPGYLATIISLLLFSSQYDFKNKSNCVLLVSLILSFSLAGYIITFCGYVFYLFIENRKKKRVFIFLLFMILFYYGSVNYNNGENIFNKNIIERIKYDEEKGLSGNNRTGDGTEFYYNQALQDNSIWLGLGAQKVNNINLGSSYSGDYSENIRGAGYKVYFVTYGVISALFFLLFYFFISKSITYNATSFRCSYIFLIIMTFIQASYPNSLSWIYPFLMGVNYKRYLNQ